MIFSATLPLTGSLLLGHEHDAEAAFANLLQELVVADYGAPGLRRLVAGQPWRRARRRRVAEKTVALVWRQQASRSGRGAPDHRHKPDPSTGSLLRILNLSGHFEKVVVADGVCHRHHQLNYWAETRSIHQCDERARLTN